MSLKSAPPRPCLIEDGNFRRRLLPNWGAPAVWSLISETSACIWQMDPITPVQ
jgi:hypothetical protein